MRFPRPAAQPRWWWLWRRLRDAGLTRDVPAGAGDPGLRDGTVSGGSWLERDVPGPEVRVPGSCAPRNSGRARVSAETGGEGWSVAAPRPESVGAPRLSHPPAGAGPPHTHTPAEIGVPSCPRRASRWRLVTWARRSWHSLVRSLEC